MNQAKVTAKTQRFEASHITPFVAKDTASARRLINGVINEPTVFPNFLELYQILKLLVNLEL